MTAERLRRLYRGLPAWGRAALPPRLEAWARARLRPGAATPRGFEDRLWGGFTEAARRDLAALVAAAPPPEAAEAALVLARSHAAEGDFATALVHVRQMCALHPPAARDRRQGLLEALFLARLGRGAEARARIDALPARRFDPSRALIAATAWGASPGGAAEALGAINAVFRRHGLQDIGLRDPSGPLALDNLRGADPGPKSGSPARISVIVPAFAAEATLPAALASLADQTHADLEVLVVDDASPDGTADVAADAARADPRFRLIRQPENLGGYAARNRALAQATGDFVTVHDADDWSHPEKLARQLRALIRSKAASNVSTWVRTTPDLAFLGPARVFPDLMGLNDSATLFRRDLFSRFGGWDDARIGADKELIWRFERLEGRPPEAFRRRLVLPDCPLAFGRHAPASLTRTSATHVLTVYHGLRREYREAAAFWHAGLDPARIRSQGLGAGPPFFPAPPMLRARPPADPGADILFIGDFNFQGGTQKSALHMIRAARAAGLRAALLHYRRYDQDVTAPLDPGVRRLAGETGTRILAPGERLRAATVVVTYPPVFAERMDRFPQVAHDRLVVVVNQLAERDRARTDIAYEPGRVRANLAALLGGEGEWTPISPLVRALMVADPRYPPPAPDTWTPLVDPAPFAARPACWRGAAQARPVLGRHGRDHPLKWPRDAAAIRAAYGAGRPCETRFLGGAFHARRRLGRWPRNWRDIPFDGMEVPAFLAGLDVFIHHPDPDYIEEFGRAPMEAMAAGLPVILAPELAPTFGAAALYAPPEGVWPLVERLWGDRAFWEARSAAGRAFVAANCGYDRFPARLARPA